MRITYTFRKDHCTECGEVYQGFFSDTQDNLCTKCRCEDHTCENLRSLKVMWMFDHYDPSLQSHITGYRQKNRLMKEKDLVCVGDYQHMDDIPLGKPNLDKHFKDDDAYYETWQKNVVQNASAADEDV